MTDSTFWETFWEENGRSIVIGVGLLVTMAIALVVLAYIPFLRWHMVGAIWWVLFMVFYSDPRFNNV